MRDGLQGTAVQIEECSAHCARCFPAPGLARVLEIGQSEIATGRNLQFGNVSYAREKRCQFAGSDHFDGVAPRYRSMPEYTTKERFGLMSRRAW